MKTPTQSAANVISLPSSTSVVSFAPGLTYSGRSIGDHNCVWFYTVISRTAKQVTLQEVDSNKPAKRFGVRVYNGVEYCSPHGRYSMSLSLSADNAIATLETSV